MRAEANKTEASRRRNAVNQGQKVKVMLLTELHFTTPPFVPTTAYSNAATTLGIGYSLLQDTEAWENEAAVY